MARDPSAKAWLVTPARPTRHSSHRSNCEKLSGVLTARIWVGSTPDIGSAPAGSADRGAGRVAEDGDDAALADPPAVVVTPGQHVVEVGDMLTWCDDDCWRI